MDSPKSKYVSGTTFPSEGLVESPKSESSKTENQRTVNPAVLHLSNDLLKAHPQHQIKEENSHQPDYLLQLNDDAFQAILSHLSYDETAKIRLVCKKFNEVCQKRLNKGFMAVQRYHNRCLKEMKAKLPRRESERRSHPLARHIDVLTGIETRLSLLSMTYYKYTVLGIFCFIPGKVLDECFRILREVVVHKNPPKSYELLQELRDISSMAMEHFEEHIVPTMKRSLPLGSSPRNNSPRILRCSSGLMDEVDSESTTQQPSSSQQYPSVPSACQLSTPIRSVGLVRAATVMPISNKLDFSIQQNRMLINNHRRQIVDMKSKLVEYGRKIVEQDRLLHEYGRKIIQLESKLSQFPTPVPESSTASTSTAIVSRKRPAKVMSSSSAKEENPSSGKRKPINSISKNSLLSFSMSLRKRKS